MHKQVWAALTVMLHTTREPLWATACAHQLPRILFPLRVPAKQPTAVQEVVLSACELRGRRRGVTLSTLEGQELVTLFAKPPAELGRLHRCLQEAQRDSGKGAGSASRVPSLAASFQHASSLQVLCICQPTAGPSISQPRVAARRKRTWMAARAGAPRQSAQNTTAWLPHLPHSGSVSPASASTLAVESATGSEGAVSPVRVASPSTLCSHPTAPDVPSRAGSVLPEAEPATLPSLDDVQRFAYAAVTPPQCVPASSGMHACAQAIAGTVTMRGCPAPVLQRKDMITKHQFALHLIRDSTGIPNCPSRNPSSHMRGCPAGARSDGGRRR